MRADYCKMRHVLLGSFIKASFLSVVLIFHNELVKLVLLEGYFAERRDKGWPTRPLLGKFQQQPFLPRSSLAVCLATADSMTWWFPEGFIWPRGFQWMIPVKEKWQTLVVVDLTELKPTILNRLKACDNFPFSVCFPPAFAFLCWLHRFSLINSWFFESSHFYEHLNTDLD